MKTLLFVKTTLNLVLIIVNNLKQKKMADNFQSFQDVLGDINNSTNQIAQTLESLKGTIANAGLNKTQEDQILGQLSEAANKLRGIGTPESPTGEGGGTTETGTGTTTEEGGLGG